MHGLCKARRGGDGRTVPLGGHSMLTRLRGIVVLSFSIASMVES